MMNTDRRYVAEAIGTFALVFAGTGAIVVNDVSNGAISHVGVALTFGFVVAAMIYAIGDISGAHINPAVTIGFWMARRIPRTEVIPYIASQILGALVASYSVRFLFSSHPTLGATLPNGSEWQSFGLEIIITFLLMYTILNVSIGAKEKDISAGVAIGCVVGFAALFAGPISGASMNPARSLAPAIAAARTEYLWLYLVAPVLGAGAAVVACRYSRGEGCCT